MRDRNSVSNARAQVQQTCLNLVGYYTPKIPQINLPGIGYQLLLHWGELKKSETNSALSPVAAKEWAMDGTPLVEVPPERKEWPGSPASHRDLHERTKGTDKQTTPPMMSTKCCGTHVV